jgi:orotate phosphoribosyltransferase
MGRRCLAPPVPRLWWRFRPSNGTRPRRIPAHFARRRGYVRFAVAPQDCKTDYVVVEDVTSPGGSIVTHSSFVVEAGKPGVIKA